MKPLLPVVTIAWVAAASLAHAQAPPPVVKPALAPEEAPPFDPDADDTLLDELVVTAGPPRGAVIGDIAPQLQLRPGDIRAYGVSDLSELLDALSPQLSSGRGRGGERPVVLLNGRRISGFREVRRLPPEAIARVDILPEEVALKYGYRADQRVVNIVLRERFSAVTTEVEGEAPTAGGRAGTEVDLNLMRIQGDSRLGLEVEHRLASPVLETERDLIGAAPFRTLLPRTEDLSLGATLSRPLPRGVSATATAGLDFSESERLLGLPELDPDATRPLVRDSSSRTGHLGLALNGAAPREWRWSFTANYDEVDSLTLTDLDTAITGPRESARSTDRGANAELVANGRLFALPAGPASASLKAQVEARRFESRTLRGPLSDRTELARDRATVQANLDLPILSRRRGPSTPIGDLTASANLEVNQLSDFGTLTVVNAGLNWSPIEQVNVIASVTKEQGPPTLQQLGAPLLTTPGVPVFDFLTGQTAEVTLVEGGNPALVADRRRVVKLGLNLKPLAAHDLILTADYVRTRIDDPIAAFPTLTPEIEAAFPDRAVRDSSGRLVQIDTRPVNFARSDREEIRWGFNFSRRLAPPPRDEAGDRPRRAGGRTPGGEGGGPSADGLRRFGGGGRGGRGGRLQLALYHTWRLRDSVLIRDGVPELDFLGGSALGAGGGAPRHQLDLQAGLFRSGLGARVDARWQSGTTVHGGVDTPGAAGDLTFSDLTTVNLRLFADLGQVRGWGRRHPWLRATRVGLEADNLFDSRLQVRDAAGRSPLAYQPAYLDPIGRTVRISVRKLMF